MGTKIEYPLATPTNYSLFSMDNNRARATTITSTSSIQFDMDTIKRTMQIQDDIFRHQVKELHRLYSVQRKLMLEMKSVERSGSCSGKTRNEGEEEDEEEDGEERVELTLSIGSSNNKKIYRGGEVDIDSNNITTTTSSSGTTFDNQEKKMPHWLLGLSINRS